MLLSPVVEPSVAPCLADPWLPSGDQITGRRMSGPWVSGPRVSGAWAAVDPDDDDLGDEEDLAVSQPLADEESSFDDFDDEFDDDFEEEENDPDWDHPDDDNDEPPPGKGAGGKK